MKRQKIDDIGTDLIVGATVANRMRADMVRSAVRGWTDYEPIWTILDSMKSAARAITPILAESFWGSQLAAWLHAFQWNANRLPKWLRDYMMEIGPPPIDPTDVEFGESVPRRLKFPRIESAAKSLMRRNVLQRPQFDEVSQAAKARAFTIAGENTDKAIDDVRTVLTDMTRTGPSLTEFRTTLNDELKTGLLGPAHVENVYRTNLQAAYRDGQESLMLNPIMAEVFPYQEYIPIHDTRTRVDHLALESLGLNGTAIYRRDDPFWDRFTPPNGYNCRCTTNLLTLEAAARRGVKEAQRWLNSGDRPDRPEYRNDHIPFDPTPGFGQKHGHLIAV